jgi:holo-[acyl-carrier protein] synthase
MGAVSFTGEPHRFETHTTEPTSMTPPGYIVGHGVDAVDIADCTRLMTLAAGRHLDRYFTVSELADIGHGARQAERLAGRLAIKEAVLKALGVGWGDGVAFTDVETVSKDTGAPAVVLHRRASALEKERLVGRWLVSMSHTGSVAVASAIALSL